jgi:acetyl-CoA carboxylase biotin carboxyl carrier protein
VKIDIDQIRELLAIVSATDITELTVEVGEEKLTVKKTVGSAQQAAIIYTPQVDSPRMLPRQTTTETRTEASSDNAEHGESNNGLVPVTSPMVGTFYRAPSPTAPSYVEIGDRIAIGQTVCIIEAMKLMNDMPAEVSGRIVKVCVENGSTVEYGQNLFLVDPKG